MNIITFHGKKVPAMYLGDGVYAIYDGFGIWLHANDHEHPTDKIYLEPDVFKALVQFKDISKSKEVMERCQQEQEHWIELTSGQRTSGS